MNEFDLISKYFKPLASGFPGSLNLTDDAALIDVPEGMQLVITKDAICEGIHFIGDEAPALIAQKLLRTNLSDLAAKGAKPLCYFLAGMLPSTLSSSGLTRGSILSKKMDPRVKPEDDIVYFLQSFASGLAQDQKEFGIHLAGGDTTSTNGSLCLSLTALGLVPKGQMLKRSGAKIGDGIYVSGTLGDSALGLASSQAGQSNDGFLIRRYQLPEPRIELGLALRGIATSCMDISDGLVQDLGHVCKASNIGATIYTHQLPLSDAAKSQSNAILAALSGGDDYELLFTAKNLDVKSLPFPVAKIGEVKSGNEVKILDESGEKIEIEKKGFSHF